jgi:APA family basic amino acid/polyamine antiporter
MPSQLFLTKSHEELLEELRSDNRLRRVLGPVQLSSLGVGAIIGTGIFVLTGVAAHDRTGPSLTLSFVVAGITCIFAALCYAEFASMVPVAGSAYTYAYATLGELLAAGPITFRIFFCFSMSACLISSPMRPSITIRRAGALR